jgi:hypothetical protein
MLGYELGLGDSEGWWLTEGWKLGEELGYELKVGAMLGKLLGPLLGG